MITKKLRLILPLLLLVGILSFNVLNSFQEGITLSKELRTAWTVANLIATFFILIATMNFKWLIQLVNGHKYIDGKYIGRSMVSDPQNEKQVLENFTINESLLETTVSGYSENLNGKLISTWEGILYEQVGNEYCFLLKLKSNGVDDLGMLSIRIEEGEVNGFYYSTEANTTNFKTAMKAFRKDLYNKRKSELVFVTEESATQVLALSKIKEKEQAARKKKTAK